MEKEGSSENQNTTTPVVSDKKHKRKGKGAKQRHQDAFRDKKNQEFVQQHDAKILAFKISLGYEAEDIFGSRRVIEPEPPQIEVAVSTDIIEESCVRVATVLHQACKIPAEPNVVDPIQYDTETLINVTKCQVESKVYHARVGSDFTPDLNNADEVGRVAKLLTKAVSPLAAVVDQYGKFRFDEQVFIPAIQPMFPAPAEEPMFGPDLFGRPLVCRVNEGREQDALEMGLVNENGRPVPQLREMLNHVPWQQVIRFEPLDLVHNRPNLQELSARYTHLCARINKRLVNAIVDVSIEGGKGSESQLTYIVGYHNGEVEVYSPRNISNEALQFGALLRLGVNDSMCGQSMTRKRAYIDVSGALDSLSCILTKRIR